MHPLRWVSEGAQSLLDVGCNVGAFLEDCDRLGRGLRLAGVEVNQTAREAARRRLPHADIRGNGAEDLPFPDETFDCVTCIEVLEHIPGDLRVRALGEMRRVLRPGGRLVLRTPHAGTFAWMDTNNFRFRFPWLYRKFLGRGLRDSGYEGGTEDVVWHHHFTRSELLALAGDGWEVEATHYGGLVIFPLMDLFCWPFYRAGLHENAVVRAFHVLADLDYGCDFGADSYGILLSMRRV
jgi:SAM-dependent methyltransferase